MASLLVLVAHSGQTLSLDCGSATRVDAVQAALAAVTGIPVAEQIVMCHGTRLDPAKALAAYKLPAADAAAAEDAPVFLYHRSFLRPGAAPPPAEPLPVLEVVVPGLPHVGLRHPLHAAHSPLIRALPDYEAQFSQQLGEARAYLDASSARLHRCRRLMSEQEVQARAADAARANVESHYAYIAGLYASFIDKYVVQHRHHSSLLAQFGELSAALAAVQLPPQLASPGCRVLADLSPRAKLADWHDSCSRSHEQFGAKVLELEGVFQLLRADVERLFLQAPSVDLDALGQQLGEAEGLVAEQASVVQVLAKDLATVQQLVEDVVAQLGGSAGGASLSGAAVHDSCAAVDALLEQHLHSLLPRVRGADKAVTEFLLRCGDAKAAMTRDVLEQLQGIACQQSRIRDMKAKLALFGEVMARQGGAFAELQAVTRVPAAYRLALAECARRAAWQEMFAGQASKLAEHCGRITAKEAAKRESVRRQLERHLPQELLARAGLLAEPPHCAISLPPSDVLLLPVSTADIARLPEVIQQAGDAAAAAEQQQRSQAAASQQQGEPRLARTSSESGDAQSRPPPPGAGSSSGMAPPGAGRASLLAASTVLWPPARPAGPDATPSSAAAVSLDTSSELWLENARLRAELASLLAQQAARDMGEPAGGPSGVPRPPGALAASQLAPGQGLAPAAGGAACAASMLLGASTSSTAGAAGSPVAAPPAAPAGPRARPYGHGGPATVPAGVAAALPDVSAALAQAALADEADAAAAAARQALALAPVQAALAAKDDLVGALEGKLQAALADAARLQARVVSLEQQLATAFRAATANQAAPVLQAGSSSSSSDSSSSDSSSSSSSSAGGGAHPFCEPQPAGGRGAAGEAGLQQSAPADEALTAGSPAPEAAAHTREAHPADS